MAQATSIEWTDQSSNPLRYRDAAGKTVWACAKVSSGCRHCYAEAIAHRYKKGGPFSLAQVRKVTPYLDEKECRRLLTSKKLSGKRVFTCDMTDLFGEWVPFEMIDRLFAVFALRPDVVFQILTKRPERMAEYLNTPDRMDRNIWQAMVSITDQEFCEDHVPHTWPLPGVWLGTSVENQETADERVVHLLKCPAVVRFISAEPLLGPVDLYATAAVHHGRDHSDEGWSDLRGIDWIIVGGESGPGARPCNIEWIRSIVRQCREAAVPCFVKQLGANIIDRNDAGWDADSHRYTDDPCNGDRAGKPVQPGAWPDHIADEDRIEHDLNGYDGYQGAPVRVRTRDSKGGDPAEWPADLRVREFPIGRQEAQNAQKESESVRGS